jgi:hypothetical protein
MKFTLTYDGELKASGNSPKPKEKWTIRQALHPQLMELWQTHPVLSRTDPRIPAEGGYWSIEQHHSVQPSDPSPPKPEEIRLCAPINVGRANFVPLVRNSMALVCHLDILFLRKEEPGKLVQKGGDLDNRIKTLFDGLRMPKRDELRFASDPIESPFHCLLEDDALITGFRVTTGHLLTRPNGNIKEVRLVIDVTVKVTHVRQYNLPLLGD